MRKLVYLILLASVVLLNACSDSGSDSPSSDSNVHPDSWFSTHPGPALATPDFADCTSCHGDDLRGSGEVVSCYSCHSYNDTPPFTIHPASWGNDPYLNHRSYAAVNGFGSCRACHGNDLRGYQVAPSCYAADFNGVACHADGPQAVPHPVYGTLPTPPDSYLVGTNHGPDAKANLIDCQQCHGQPGGSGSNPRFNIGIYVMGGNGCEPCHGVDYAHPPDWPDHYTAGNIQAACSLCHGTNLNGVGGVGTSCLDCHNLSPGTYPSGCLSCHGQPPNSAAPVGDVRPNEQGLHDVPSHSIGISAVPGETCQRCHDGSGTGTVVHYTAVPPVGGLAPAAVKIFHPDPLDTIEATTTPINTTCTGVCHFGGISITHDNRTWY